jgi:cellulose synthase/poly-beta-1,6-N-acetylglucosamine synthase-like glycosyltransferase
MARPVVYVIFLILFVYCSLSVIYTFLLAFWGRFFWKEKKWKAGVSHPKKRIAILVPAYKEDNVILFTADNLLNLDYPRELYDVYIIADSFRPETLQALKKLPLHVLEVAFDNSTKTKSLNLAFEKIDKEYDIALICDGDNMLGQHFLRKTNDAFAEGARATQGKRIAKNLDSSFAILDACSEAINNNIFRKGTNALGLSSAICGSGMAFEYNTVKQVLSEIDVVGGFDKVLQLKILQRHIFIYYLDHALIYDEKVGSSFAFSQQRKRWISSQMIYSRLFFFPAFRELFKGNISYFNLAVANYCILPKAFLMVILPLLALFGLVFSHAWGMSATVLWIVYLLSLLLALPRVLINMDLLRAVFTIPRAVSLMFGALFRFRKSDERFIHTPHTKTGITNPGKGRL